MYIKYADNKKICNALAAYHVGEVVAALVDTKCEDGVIEAYTKLKITNIEIKDGIFLPEIPENQLCNYTSDCDEYNFIYTVTPIESVEGDKYDFNSSEFVRADEFVGKEYQNIYRAKEKTRKKAATKYWVKGISLLAAGYIGYTIIISLFLLPIFAVFEKNLIVAPITALGISFLAMLFSMLSETITSTFIKLTSSHCITKRKDR